QVVCYFIVRNTISLKNGDLGKKSPVDEKNASHPVNPMLETAPPDDVAAHRPRRRERRKYPKGV
ncbi:hypothetical protein, partial [Rhodospirillum rubrum]|uniref:hypothetical protein n=1 Tax=Rhodospirillum rubrum TaxID=1085 RepID=UPI0028B03F4F